MKIFAYLFCLVVFYSCVETGKFRPELQSKIDKLSSEKELGFNDSTSLAFLNDSASREELLKLLNHKKPIIRIISYRALVNRNDKDFFDILKARLTDTAKITWWYYDDAAADFTISDLMIRKVKRNLNRTQKDTLIELVLLHHSYLESSNWMMQDIKPHQKYYSSIRSRAVTPSERCGIQMGATYSLAKFNKQENIELIKKNLLHSDGVCSDWVFKSIEVFPDTAFYPALKNYFENHIKKKKQSSFDDLKYFCRALAQFKNENSLSIFLSLTQKKTYPDDWYYSYNQEYIFRAIHKYYSPFYDKLYKALKRRMDDYVLKNLDKPDYEDYTTW